jgi:phosphoribosylglycinamide formyltransferase-1
VVVLISGRGTNAQAIIDGAQTDLPISLRAVVSDQPDAYGLMRARDAGIPTEVVAYDKYPSKAAFEAALQAVINRTEAGLVVLAGFMRILTARFVAQHSDRLINIHPSLLPAFPGLNTHQRALEAGCREHGATVHFVTADVDQGPIIVQARVPILADDTPARLAERVLKEEHRILPLAVRWFAEGRLTMRDNRVWLDDRPALDAAHG